MDRATLKLVRKLAVAIPIVAIALYFIPVVTVFFLVCGLIDVMRNDVKTVSLFRGYFLGNGMLTWLLSPFNLVVDLISRRNPGVWKLDDFPAEYRGEIERVLDIFKERRADIISEIDSKFTAGRRGMYVYQWFGKPHNDTVPEFTRPYKYIRTIAVSVFSGRESTSYHFGPLRLTLRVLYNLTPVPSQRIFIECGNAVNRWDQNPLFIFDDTLLHRSVNDHDGRRYCVFMDIVRPSPLPAVLSALTTVVSATVERFNAVFYKNWKMLGSGKPKAKQTV